MTTPPINIPGEGFDIPDPFAPLKSIPSPIGVAPISVTKHAMESRHAARWVFISIGIFIAVVSLVAVVFLVYGLFTKPVSTVIPTYSPVPVTSIAPAEIGMPVLVPEILSNDTSDLADPDNDGLTNAEERYYGTDPNIPDTDGDSYLDGDEVRNGYNPLGSGKLDSDNDGFPDPDERKFGTDPFNPDTDKDGYSDGEEITRGYNPLIASPNDKL
ncbi:MAG: hypothetical protein O3A36_00950 [bacterium]|nr:hypothetical protein [bacterium]